MAQNFTYDELLALVPSYATRTDDAFLTQIPTFISLAENRLATDMKQQGFQTVVSGTLPLNQSMPKPAFWRETIGFSYVDESGQRQPILLRSYEYCRNYAPTSAPGVPKFYADYNIANFLVVPTPSQEFEFELTYYARLQPLSPANQTNWLTLNMPQALLAAIMLEASIWLRNTAETQKWSGMYQGATSAALQENQERIADRNLVVTKG